MLPDKFINRMKYMLGQECDAFLVSFECERSKALRLNPLKLQGGRDEAKGKLPYETKDILWEENGFVYKDEDEPGKSALHMAGLYYIQEPSAMSPVAYLDPKPGHRVLDLCAAPGGKSTQIAGRMQGRGVLISNEINAGRAKILSENIERMGISNAMVLNETPENLSSRFEGWFDRILIDAPCSGEGMFRKNEDAVTNWSPDNVRLCADRQDGILDNAAAMLAPNGRLVYSTCTFAPDEDEGTIYRFLLRHPEFKVCEVPLFEGMDRGNPEWALIDSADEGTWHDQPSQEISQQLSGCIRLWPHHLKGEGHFLAVLERVNEAEAKDADAEPVTYCPGGFQRGIKIEQKNMSAKEQNDSSNNTDSFKGLSDLTGNEAADALPGAEVKKETKKKLKAKDRRAMDKNAGRNLKGSSRGGSALDMAARLWEEFAGEVLTETGSFRIYGTLFTFGDNVYLAPPLMPSTDRLKVMRPGLHLGTIKKDRFEPSHSLALFLRMEDVKHSADYPADSQEIKDFTSGLTLSAGLENAWYLITADGCSIGWAKSDGRRLKNHYPKGLRINYAD